MSRNKALWQSISGTIESLKLDCFRCTKREECGPGLDFLCWSLVKAAVLEQESFEVPFPKGE